MTALQAGLPVLGWLGIIVLAVHEAVYGVRHAVMCRTNKVGHRCSCWLGHRFLSGGAFHGYVVTDATYWKRANNTDGDVSPFQKLPKWQRRALRTGPVLAALGALISWPLTLTAVSLAAGCAALWCTLRGRKLIARVVAALAPRRLRERLGRRHGRRRHDLAGGLADITKTASVAVKPQIEWNPDYASVEPGDDVVTWYTPSGFRADQLQKSKVEDLFRGRVGFDLVPRWKLDAMPPHVVFARARELPGIVYLHDVVDRLDALDDSQAGIGLDGQDGLGGWNWADENPHGVMNAGSRHGKTEINKCLVSQIIRKGGGVTYIDPKEISLQGMEGIPGLILRNDPGDIPAMWEAIADFRHLMDGRRIERARLGKEAVAGWNRQLLVLEEVNQFSEQSDDFWEDLPEEEEGFLGTELWKPRRAKKTPRVWRHVKAVAWQGAAFKMHVFVDGQDVQATVLKGVRNSLGMRLLGAYQPSQWKFLVGTTPVPPAPNHKGRFCLVRGGEQTWLQAILADKDPDKSSAIWRDYATGGRPADGAVSPVAAVTYHVDPEGLVRPVYGKSAKTVTGDPRGVLVSLADAVAGGVTPGATLKALRMDRHRSDKDELPDGLKFPEPGGYDGISKELFWSAELAEFNAARRGSLKGAGR